MRNRFIVFVLAACLHTTLWAGRATVSGNVANGKFTVAQTSYYKGFFSFSEIKHDFPIDKKGNFKLVFDLDRITDIYLVINDQQTDFYLTPGDSITLRINYADFDNSLAFGGSNSEKNMLYKAFNQKFITGHEQELYYQVALRKAPALAAYCDSLLDVELKFISSNPGKADAVFLNEFQAKLVYESAVSKLNYQSLWAHLRHKKDTLPDVPANYYAFMKKLPLDSEALLPNHAYFDYVKAAMYHYTNQVTTFDQELPPEEKMQVANVILKSPKVKLAYEGALVYNSLRFSGFSAAESSYLSFSQRNPGSVYLPELNELYASVRKIAPGQPAPEISLVDDQGKACKLSDFKGKVVYLDFWASWCGPCMQEMPYSKKLNEEFAQKDVVFLYVSIDEDPASWKAAIAKQNIAGVNVITPGWDTPVCQSYNIKGVPYYFLIGRDGMIISNTPSRPSTGDIVKAEIYAALGK